MKLKSVTLHEFAIALLIACLVGVCYSSVIVNRYGFYDDYIWLNGASFGEFTAQGRPLNDLFANIGFSWAKFSIDKLSVLRSITVFGIWCVGWGLYNFCRAHRLTTITSLALACSIILLPSFQVFASWAIAFPYPYSALLALAAAFLLTPPASALFNNQAARITSSVALLLAALLIYQPAAMFFCAAVVLSLIASASMETPWKPGRIFTAAMALGIALGLGFLVQRAGLAYISISAPRPAGVGRFTLVHDVAGKLHWYVSELLTNAFSLYIVPGSSLAAGVVLTVIIVGAVLYCRRLGRPAWLALTGVVCFLIGASLPNLVTAENWATYRSTVAISAAIAVLAVLMGHELGVWATGIVARGRFPKLSKRGLLLVPAIFIGLAGYSAYSNVFDGFVAPNVALLEALEKQVKDSGKPSTTIIRLLQEPPPAYLVSQDAASLNIPVRMPSASFVSAYDEFGFFMSRMGPPTTGMTILALRDAGLATSNIVLEKDPAARVNPGPDDLLLDFRSISLCSNKYTRDVFYPVNLTRTSWEKGLWKDGQLTLRGFVYYSRGNCGSTQVHAGDVLRFKRSGLRHVIKVEDASLRPYVTVVVDGLPLSVDDGYPAFVIRESHK